MFQVWQPVKDGSFTIGNELADGAAYSVAVSAQPAGQNCSVSAGEGTISGANVSDVAVNCADLPGTSISHLEGAGDSIMRGYNASCTGNTGLFDVFCYGGGDQNQNSFLDGSNSGVVSLLDRYRSDDSGYTGSKNASESGSEMTDAGKNNFASQAAAIVSAASQPTTVVVELGGNDLCNRSDANFYTDAQWQTAVDAGLQVLVDGLPEGSSVYLSSVPRVHQYRNSRHCG